MPTRKEIRQAYQTLELSEGASEDEIKKAYKRLSLKWHPDKNGNSEESTAKFQEISDAKNILDNKDNVSNDYYEPQNTDYYPSPTSEEKENIKRIIRESLAQAGLTQTEFKNLLTRALDDAEYYANFSSTIDRIERHDMLIIYLETVLKMILICCENKMNNELDSKIRSVFQESENWGTNWQNDWKKSETNSSYSFNNWEQKFTEDCKKKYIDNIEFTLRLKSVSEDKLNKKLGVTDWRDEINKHSDWIEAQQRSFKIEKTIYALDREYTCAHCKAKKDDVWAPWEADGEKFCSLEHKRLWQRKKRKESPIGGIIVLVLLIAGIIWLVRRRKKINK